MADSLNFGLYCADVQVGYARVVTDRATFAWLCDVYVLPEHRGNGLGRWLVEVVLDHPDLRELRRILLATADAHGLYAEHGFAPLGEPSRFMAIERSAEQLYANRGDEPGPFPREQPPAEHVAATGETTVRLARPADTGDLARLLGQLGYPTTTEDVAARLSYWLPDPASRVLVAEREKRVCAALSLHRIPLLEKTGWRCRIETLVVENAARGMGVGRLLVSAAERHAAAHGCLDVEVTSARSRDNAHSFYQRLGYVDLCDRSGRFVKELSLTPHENAGSST